MPPTTFIATTGSGVARATSTGDSSWEVEHLLQEQDVRALATDPLSPSVVYAGTQGNGVFRSDDGGKTWKPRGLDGAIVKTIAASRSEPGTVYAGTKPARLYVSRDGGAQWTELEGFRHVRGRKFWFSPAEPPFTAYVQGIGLSPADSSVIVVGIEAGAVVRSSDGGDTWSTHRSGALRDCHSLTFHAAAGDWVYEAGGTGAGAAYSRDGGISWTQPRDGLDRHYGWACAADSEQPEVWYASLAPTSTRSSPFVPPAHVDGKASAFIYRKEGDSPWRKLGGGLPEPLDYMAYALLTDPDAGGHVYAGLANGDVWHSQDHGERWERMSFSLGGVRRSMVML